MTASGIETTAEHHELDLIVWATGFDAITGAFDHVDIRGTGGRSLRDAWGDGPRTWYGLLTHGFPNLVMIAGPQSVSGSTNFPRAIEGGVNWATDFIDHVRSRGCTRFEVSAEAEDAWGEEVARAYERLLLRESKGWFTGYNSNVAGHGEGRVRHQAYFGPGPKYAEKIRRAAEAGYPPVSLD